jgi:hypothetical protein
MDNDTRVLEQVVAEVQAEIDRVAEMYRMSIDQADYLSKERGRLFDLKGRIEDIIKRAEKRDE